MFPSVRLEQGVPCRRSHLAKVYKTGTAPSTGRHKKTLMSTELLGDLISFGGGINEDSGMACVGSVNSQGNKAISFDNDLVELLYTPWDTRKKVDHMIEANLSDFSSQGDCDGQTVNSYNVSRRKLHGKSKVM